MRPDVEAFKAEACQRCRTSLRRGIIAQAKADRAEEYRDLEIEAHRMVGDASDHDRARRALGRRLSKVIARDHFKAPEGKAARAAVGRQVSPLPPAGRKAR